VAQACGAAKIPIRIGVNGGSLNKQLLAKYGGVTAEALVDSALTQTSQLEACGFGDICVSLKCSDVPLTIAAYRLIREKSDVPLHVGVTEAGTKYHGIIKSAIGIGALLFDGIGDTIRVSLCEDVVEEVRAGKAILQALGLRNGVEVIACPTCGRSQVDVRSLALDVEQRLENFPRPIKVAVMGCEVNGPGEARDADFGIAGGGGQGVIFVRGEIVAKVSQNELVSTLMKYIEKA